MLDVQVQRRLGSFALDASFTVPVGSVTVIVGESGSGKSTLLRLVAGLLVPDQGRVAFPGQVVSDSRSGVWVPSEARAVGHVAQDYALFPHLDARDNVAFGLRAVGGSKSESRQRAERALERFGLAGLGGRRPAQLSGGQQQRVALARALILDPEVLLLDEPLSALDLMTRRAVRGELRRTLESLPCATLLVTHQPTEALLFADQIVVLESGKVTQSGSRADFVQRPRSRYVAEFLGVNLFEGSIATRGPDGPATVRVEDVTLAVADPGPEDRVQVMIHPHDIVLSLDRPAGSALNVLHGPIEDLTPELPAHDRVRVQLATRPALTAQISRHSVEALGLRRGSQVHASFKASAVHVFPA